MSIRQLSLAIGKKGQNVRLAAKLTGWRIDIKSEEEKRKEVEAEFGAIEAASAEGTETVEDEVVASESDAVTADPAPAEAVADEPTAEETK